MKTVKHFFLIFAIVLFSFLMISLAACQSGNENDDDSTGDDDSAGGDDDSGADDDSGDDDSGEYQIQWTDCPDYISIYLFAGQKAQCAKIPMPLNYSDPNSQTIPIFIFKIFTTSVAQKTGQIWFLEGGPGGPGEDYAPIMPWINRDFPDMDVFSLDHRGVGNSSKLTCPQENSYPFDYEGCIDILKKKWGDNLLYFTTTNASRDLGNIINIASKGYPKVFVYGASYGTYWAHRYLQLFPNQATGVILDSICSPGKCKLDTYDQHFNDNGKAIMNICADDATCSNKMSSIDPDPWSAIGKVFDIIDNGQLCSDLLGLDRTTLRNVLGYMEMDWLARILVPATAYRIYRCNEADVAAINNLFDTLFGKSGYISGDDDYIENFDDLDASSTLGMLVLLSELWNNTPLDQIMDIVNAAYFSIDLGPMTAEIAESGSWPTYGDDGYIDKWAQTDIPMLMLNGTLDPQTTLEMAQPAGDHFKGSYQTFVTMPQSPHGVIFQSYTDESVNSIVANQNGYFIKTCGMKTLYSFLNNPQAAPDTSCISDLYALEFSADSPINQWVSASVFGTEDMWEGAPSGGKKAFVKPPVIHPRKRGPLMP